MRFIIEGTQEELKALMGDGIMLGLFDSSESKDDEDCECEDDEADKAEKIARTQALRIEFCKAVGTAVDKLITSLG